MIPWIRRGECHVCFSNSPMIEWVLKIWSRFSWVYTRSELEFWFTLWAPNLCRYETVVKRWPIILTGIVDRLHRDCHDLTMEAQKHNDEPSKKLLEEKITEAKDIISRISKLKYQMGENKKLQWVLSSHWLLCCIYLRYRGTRRPIIDDNETSIEVYNTELAKLDQNGQGSWFTAPWLYAEWIHRYFALIFPLTQPISDATCSCASWLHTDLHSHNDAARYRYIRSYLSQSSHWKLYDPFFSQKQATLQGSGEAIYSSSIHRSELAITFLHSIFLKRDSNYIPWVRWSERCIRKWSWKIRGSIQGDDSNVSLVSNFLQCNRPSHLIDVQGKRYSGLISMTLFKHGSSILCISGLVPPDPPDARRHIASAISWKRSSTGS